MLALPARDLREELRRLAPVPDEVVVDDEDRSAPAQLVERVELAQHLRRGLHPRVAAVELDDVAELALERAPARGLHAHRGVARPVEQIESGWKSARQVRLLVVRRGEEVRAGSALQRRHQRVEAPFRLAHEHVVGVREFVGARADRRTARHGAHTAAPGALDHFVHRLLVHEHAGDQRRVRPAPVGLAQRSDVEIGDPQLPMLGKKSGESGETERRMRRGFADDADGVLETPVRLWREGLHQKHVHARDNAHRQVMEWSRSAPERRCQDASWVRAAARILARSGLLRPTRATRRPSRWRAAG